MFRTSANPDRKAALGETHATDAAAHPSAGLGGQTAGGAARPEWPPRKAGSGLVRHVHRDRRRPVRRHRHHSGRRCGSGERPVPVGRPGGDRERAVARLGGLIMLLAKGVGWRRLSRLGGAIAGVGLGYSGGVILSDRGLKRARGWTEKLRLVGGRCAGAGWRCTSAGSSPSSPS